MSACPECGAECPDGAAACPSCKKGLGRLLDAELGDGVPALVRAVDIATGLAKTMASMHEAGVAHKDLRPRNVYLVRRKGKEDLVKLLNAQADPPAGTPADHAAPEKRADARANVYSFGVILHEIVVGALPTRGVGPIKAARARGLTHAIPKPLEDLIVHCLREAPADRPATMAEVADRIAAIRSAVRAGVATPSAAEESTASGKWIAIAAGGALALAIGGYLAWRALAPPEVAPPPPPPVVVAATDAAVPLDLAVRVDAARPPDLAPAKAARAATPQKKRAPRAAPPSPAPEKPAARDPFAAPKSK